MDKKVKIARLSIISNTTLIILKIIVGILTGSVSIISEAIHSTMDLLAAIIAFFAVRVSDNPPDERHPYGHKKFENVSGVIEAVLIFVAAIWIVYEAIKKITDKSEIESIGLGSLVMLISAVINIIVSRKLYKVAKETESIALEADALHLKTDVYTSVGVAIGLGLIWLTGYTILDPIVAILVAIFILWESFKLLKNAFFPLLDVALAPVEIEKIKTAIEKFCTKDKVQYHDLRTRIAGNFKYIDFHLNIQDDISVKDAHEICDLIENEILKGSPNAEVTIHVETFDHH